MVKRDHTSFRYTQYTYYWWNDDRFNNETSSEGSKHVSIGGYKLAL